MPKEKVLNMSRVQFQFAKDENGFVVDINWHIDPMKTYRCLKCNRRMIACKGEIIIPYFRHEPTKGGEEKCQGYDKNVSQSHEHEAAKSLFRERLEKWTICIDTCCEGDCDLRLLHQVRFNGCRAKLNSSLMTESGEFQCGVVIYKENEDKEDIFAVVDVLNAKRVSRTKSQALSKMFSDRHIQLWSCDILEQANEISPSLSPANCGFICGSCIENKQHECHPEQSARNCRRDWQDVSESEEEKEDTDEANSQFDDNGIYYPEEEREEDRRLAAYVEVLEEKRRQAMEKMRNSYEAPEPELETEEAKQEDIMQSHVQREQAGETKKKVEEWANEMSAEDVFALLIKRHEKQLVEQRLKQELRDREMQLAEAGRRYAKEQALWSKRRKLNVG